jgi:hypothetical protein
MTDRGRADNQPPSLRLSRLQIVVRILGGALLTGSAFMVVLGVTLLAGTLHGPRFALYWSWCFLLAVAAMLMAIWDLVLLRGAYRRRRRELFEQEFRSP